MAQMIASTNVGDQNVPVELELKIFILCLTQLVSNLPIRYRPARDPQEFADPKETFYLPVNEIQIKRERRFVSEVFSAKLVAKVQEELLDRPVHLVMGG